MLRTSWTELATPAALGAAACAACCAVPLLGLAIGTGAASALAAFIEPLAAGLLAAAALAGVIVWVRQRRRSAAAGSPHSLSVEGGCGCKPAIDEAQARSVGCTLDASELPGRGEAFRALFARALTGRQGTPGRVEWTLTWSPAVEAEARALAAAESGCCSFFTFEFERRDHELRWTARTLPGREEALGMLDRIAEATLRA